MPNWGEILQEVQKSVVDGKPDFDSVRRKYLGVLHGHTGRNVIAYYSGWLNRPDVKNARLMSITDIDMNGFMSTVNRLDRSKGLDLILHTPGGEINATEAIVNYLRCCFDGNIRAIIPQISMSAGTMIALACKQILMGSHSSIGPIDPQVNGAPAHGIKEEFEKATQAFKDNPQAAQVWIPILQKYTPTLLGECDNAIKMAEKIVGDWLETGMLKENPDKKKQLLDEFGSHSKSLNHGRHFNYQKVQSWGGIADRLEDDPELQDAVLSVHHSFMLTLSSTTAIKIVENHIGSAFIQMG
jgi:hypothetical protein